MSNVVEFRPKKREEDAYLLKILHSEAGMLSYREKDILLKMTLAMYDEDRAAFNTAADELYNTRDAFVSDVYASHITFKKEAEEAGNDYPHTLRPPKGYEWTPVEE